MNKHLIVLDGKEYNLNSDKAIELGVLEEVKKEITLTLTLAEARAIRYLTGCVGGSNDPRKASESVYWKIAQAGVDHTILRDSYSVTDGKNPITIAFIKK